MQEKEASEPTSFAQELDAIFDDARNPTLFPVVAHQLFQRDSEDAGTGWYRQSNLLLVFHIFPFKEIRAESRKY